MENAKKLIEKLRDVTGGRYVKEIYLDGRGNFVDAKQTYISPYDILKSIYATNTLLQESLNALGYLTQIVEKHTIKNDDQKIVKDK